MDAGAFLYTCWLGRLDVPTSYSIASWGGLFNRFENRWEDELLDAIPASRATLPSLAPYTATERGIAPEFAQRWPALANALFFLSVGDGAAANVGSGCVSPSRVALTMGTSWALRVLLPGSSPEVPPGLWAYRLDTQTLLGGASSEGGNVFAWAKRTLNLPHDDHLEAALQATEPDAHGLTALPLLAGERSPGWASLTTGAVQGLRTSTTPLDILLALLEAIAYRSASVADVLEGAIGGGLDLIASGGAIMESPYLLQLLADVLQRPMMVFKGEATLRGIAILALHGLGVWPSLDAFPPSLGETYNPHPEGASGNLRGRERHHRLYDTLIGHAAEIRQHPNT